MSKATGDRLARAGQSPLSVDERDRLVDAILRATQAHGGGVVVASVYARRPLRKAIEVELPFVPVLSDRQLSPLLTQHEGGGVDMFDYPRLNGAAEGVKSPAGKRSKRGQLR